MDSSIPFHIASTVLFFILCSGVLTLVKRTKTVPLFISFFIAALIIGLGLFFGLMLGMERALYGFELSAAIVLGMVDPVLGVCFLLAHLLIRPWELVEEPGVLLSVPRLLAGVAALSWMLRLLARGSSGGRIIWNKGCSLFIAFVVWLYLSTFVTQGDQALVGVAIQFLPIIVLSLLTLNVIERPEDLRQMTNTLVYSVAGAVIIALYVSLVQTEGGAARLHGLGMWSNANDLAALIALTLPFVLGRIVQTHRHVLSLLAWTITGSLLLIGLWFTQSRGGFVALGACGAAYFMIKGRAKLNVLMLGAICMILAVLLFGGVDRAAEDLELSRSARWNYLVTGLRMAKDNPIFGIGYGNYPTNYERYSTIFFEWGQRTAHSSWILALAETGIIGFALFASLFAVGLTRAWKVRQVFPEFFLSMISYGVTITFLSHTYLFTPYLLVMLSLAGFHLSHLGTSKHSMGVRRVVARVPAQAAIALLLILCRPFPSHAQVEIAGVSGGDKPLPHRMPKLASDILALKGSRAETINFQLRVRGSGCHHVVAKGFFNAAGAPVSELKVELLQMEKVITKHPSYPGAAVGEYFDPLLPLSTNQVCLAEGSKEAWLWGEVEIARAVSVGAYKGKIAFESGEELPLHLTVWSMEMPEVPTLPAYAELTTWFNLLGHFGKWHEGEAELAKKYAKEMYRHRMVPLKSAIVYPEVQRAGDKNTLDLRAKPDPASSFNSVVLQNRPRWAYFDFPATHLTTLKAEERKAYLRGVESSIESIGREDKAIIYLWDEPKKEDFAALIALAKEVRANAPSLKIMVTVPYYPELEKYVDIFVPVMDYVDVDGFAGEESYEKVRSSGGEVWWYVSCMSHGCEALADSGAPDFVIDRPSVYIRAIPWIAAKYDVSAFLYYSVNNGYQFNPKRDPWESLWDFSGNGDGTLFYPGRPGERGISSHIPVSSVRLKLWREASFDAEYLRWLKQAGARSSKLLAKVDALSRSPREWERNYQAYQSLREEIGEFLNGKEAA